ncbi:mitochondrial carrier domain-containing protein, partial [Fomitopsis betulina]
AAPALYQERGISAFYYGFGGITLKSITATGARMGTYNVQLKDYQHSKKIAPTLTTTFINGAITGLSVRVPTGPIDKIKRKESKCIVRYFNKTFRNIMADGGVTVFWSGSAVRLGRTVLSGGVLFSVYE